MARKHSIEYEDLLQYALTGLWIACTSHNSSKSSFETHAINNIRWSVFDGLNRDCSTIKYDVNNLPPKEDMYLIDSIDTSIRGEEGEDMSQHETIPTDEDVEERVLNRLRSIESLQALSNREKIIIHMKSMEATDKEIALKLGVSQQAINRTFNNIQKRMRERKI